MSEERTIDPTHPLSQRVYAICRQRRIAERDHRREFDALPETANDAARDALRRRHMRQHAKLLERQQEAERACMNAGIDWGHETDADELDDL